MAARSSISICCRERFKRLQPLLSVSENFSGTVYKSFWCLGENILALKSGSDGVNEGNNILIFMCLDK